MIKDLIHEVSKAEAKFSTKRPETLEIRAVGKASSADHSMPRLVRRIYVRFPEDGIQEYDFFIDQPEEGVLNTDKTTLSASHTWIGFPKELKGIHIISKTNKILVRLNEA